MDCSEINLKLTKNNFNPQALADYIEKHKNTILANYSEKYLNCLDVTLDITNQGITLKQLFKELKIHFRDHLKEEIVVYQKTTDLRKPCHKRILTSSLKPSKAPIVVLMLTV